MHTKRNTARHENSFYYYATKIWHFKASYESSRPNSMVKKCSTSLKYVPRSRVSNESRYKKIATTIWLELKSKLEKQETQEVFLAHYCITEICYLKLFAQTQIVFSLWGTFLPMNFSHNHQIFNINFYLFVSLMI